jgi:hypothetical protein
MNHPRIVLFAFVTLDPSLTDVAALAVDEHEAPDLCDAVSDLVARNQSYPTQSLNRCRP